VYEIISIFFLSQYCITRSDNIITCREHHRTRHTIAFLISVQFAHFKIIRLNKNLCVREYVMENMATIKSRIEILYILEENGNVLGKKKVNIHNKYIR